MSLNFAAISPHPPIIIPEIGSQDDLIKVSDTVLGMKKLAHLLLEAEIDTLIVISPHSVIYPDKFNICAMEKLFGTFAQFDAPETILEFKNDIELVIEISATLHKDDIDHVFYDNDLEFFEMDHGLMVPLYYLSKNQEYPFKVLTIAYSGQSRAKHFSFGQTLGEIIKNYNGRIGVVASGDLSHRLIQNKTGKLFDTKIVEDIKKNNVNNILYYEDDFISSAGECGYKSILILLGILDHTRTNPQILSYEGPFGVGYLVANYSLKDK